MIEQNSFSIRNATDLDVWKTNTTYTYLESELQYNLLECKITIT